MRLIVPKQNVSLLAISSDVEAVGHLGVYGGLGDGVVDPVVQGVELFGTAWGEGCVKEESKESLCLPLAPSCLVKCSPLHFYSRQDVIPVER